MANPTAGHNSAGSGAGGMGAVGVISTSTNGGAGGNGVNNFLNQSSTAFTTAHTKALLDAVNIGEVSSGTRYIGGGGTGGNLGGTSYGGLGGGADSPADGIGTCWRCQYWFWWSLLKRTHSNYQCKR